MREKNFVERIQSSQVKVVQIHYRKRLESKFIANFIFKLASNLKHFNLQFETLLAFTEAATGGFFVKKGVSEISQSSQEETFAESLLIKLQARDLQFYLKRGSGTGVFR